MDFNFAPEQLALREEARKFGAEVVAPIPISVRRCGEGRIWPERPVFRPHYRPMAPAGSRRTPLALRCLLVASWMAPSWCLRQRT